METKSKYKFVNYLWDEKKAKEFGDDQVAQLGREPYPVQ